MADVDQDLKYEHVIGSLPAEKTSNQVSYDEESLRAFGNEKFEISENAGDTYSNNTEKTAKSDSIIDRNTTHLVINDEHDGGYGWLVVLGAFTVQIATFGVISSVMQNYYQQHLFSDDPQALVKLSFVGTLSLVFINASSPVVQICISRFGLLPVMIFGTASMAVALEMAGFATQIWHLYLTQGILFGIGASCMYVIVMAITPQWFTKNRGIALGIVAGGSGMGGLVIPLIVTPLNRNLGIAWTYRILGFICLVCDVVAIFFVKERVPRKKETKKLSQILHFDVLKNTNFLIFSIASDIGLFGYFVPFFFVPAYATHLGLTDSQSSSLISVCSAMNFLGRLVVGLLADHIGHLNANICFTLLAAFSSLLIWTFAFTYAALIGFMLVFGFSCGAYFALMSPISAHILGMEKFPSGLSILLMLNAIPVFGSNISSAIETNIVPIQPYITYKLFGGFSYLCGAIILIFLKFKMNRNPFVKI